MAPVSRPSPVTVTALLPPGRHLSPEDVLERTDGSGVAVNSLAAFYAANVTESGLVLGYGAIPLPQIEDGLQLLRQLLDCPYRPAGHGGLPSGFRKLPLP